jgi:hypothetical protein
MRYVCEYGAGTYTVNVPDLRTSPYFGLLPSVLSLAYLPYYSTIDDPVMIDIAKQLSSQLEGRRERVKATVVLAFVQQNIKYVPDEKQYSLPDMWALPIMTLNSCKGDCDCMANLYVSIAHNMGLDVATVHITGHMLPAVSFEGGHGQSYRLGDKDYYHMEVTDTLSVAGRFWTKAERFEGIAKPAVPTVEFKNMLKKA